MTRWCECGQPCRGNLCDDCRRDEMRDRQTVEDRATADYCPPSIGQCPETRASRAAVIVIPDDDQQAELLDDCG